MEYRDQLIYINEIIDANYSSIQNMIYNITNIIGNNQGNNLGNNLINDDNNIEFRDDIIYNNENYDFIHFDYLIKIFNNLFI